MALKMTNSEVDGTSVVTLDGRIVLGEESKSLREPEGPNRRRKEANRPEYGRHHLYRQHGTGHPGRRVCERENSRRIAQAL